MKLASTAIVSAMLMSLSVLAQTPPAPPGAPQPTKPAPEQPKPTPPDPSTIPDAQNLLHDVAKAYHDAKTMTDTMKIEFKAPEMAQTNEVKVVIGSGNDASMKFDEFTLTAVNDTLYIVREGIDDKYFSTKVEGSFADTIEQVTGGQMPVPMHFALRAESEGDVDVSKITLGILPDAEVAGKRSAKTEDGTAVDEVVLKSENGGGAIQVNPKTKLIHAVNLELSPHMEGAGNVTVKITMSPQVRDSLAEPIAFNTGSRKAVDSIDALEPEPVQEGQPAPDFTLSDLGGESVTLSKLKGSAVVLDFWATWCGPCKMALPKVQEFAKWAESSGQPIKVYAVDVWEHTSGADQTKEKVGEFWKSKGYTFPTLLDLDQAVVKKYGFQSIPTTVIVAPDGKIFRIHTGFSPDIVDTLKTDVGEALKSSG